MSDILKNTAQSKFYGVQELLQKDCTIRFEALFGLRHLGRVVDLAVYELRDFIQAHKEKEELEARIRQSIDLLLMSAWIHYRKGETTKCIEFEIGWDSERIAVAVTSFVNDGVANVFNSIEGETDKIHKYITSVQKVADSLIVRHHPKVGYFQAFAVINANATETKIESGYVILDETSAIEDIALQDTATAKEPLAKAVDVQKFLNNEAVAEEVSSKVRERKENGEDTPTVLEAKRAIKEEPRVVSGEVPELDNGEIVVPGLATEEESKTIVKGTGEDLLNDEAIKVAGGPLEEQDTSQTVVKGNFEREDQTSTLVKGSAEKEDTSETIISGDKIKNENDEKIIIKELESMMDAQDDEKIVISGDGTKDLADLDAVTFEADALPTFDEEITKVKAERQKKEIQKVKIKQKNKVKIDDVKETVAKIKKASLTKNDDKILEVLKDSTLEEAHVVADIILESKVEGEENTTESVENLIRDLEKTSEKVEKVIEVSESVVEKSGDDFEQKIKMTQKVVEKLEMSDKIKSYISTALGDLTKNRALLEEQMKEVNSKWRAAQLDFSNKQGTLKTEISKQENIIRQKDMALEKSKEALAQTLKSLEHYKDKAESSSDVEISHKLAVSTSILNRTKEMNEKLKSKIEDVQKRLSTEMISKSQVTAENTKLHRQVNDLSRKLAETDKAKDVVKEDPHVKADLDRANKQIEELKKQAKMLQDRLTSATTNSKINTNNKSGGNKEGELSDAEFKHKLEQSEKMKKILKDDYDKLSKKLEESKQAETKMRVEMSKLQAELKTAQKNLKKAG